jgi:hypothetical protein
MPASPRASRRRLPASKPGSRGRNSRSIAAPPSARSAGSWGATHGLPGAMRSASSRRRACQLGSGSNGWSAASGTSGRATAKAATCCAPMSPNGRPRPCGALTSNSPKRKPRSESTKASSRSGRSGTSANTASWLTSWSASWPMCCGRRSSNGRAAPASATLRAPCSKNLPPSPAPTSYCLRQPLPATRPCWHAGGRGAGRG